LKILAKNTARPWGFTLIELLTVVAIIAVLATLLTATLANAKRKARKAACVSNLHQIALAYNMYLDDHRKRPPLFENLLAGRYLTQRALLCPEDKVIEGWAGAIEDLQGASSSLVVRDGFTPPPTEVQHSYFKSMVFSDDLWQQFDDNPFSGIAACQLHGIGRQDKDTAPSLYAYQGLVLRALKDGSVVMRQVFLTPPVSSSLSAPVASGGSGTYGPIAELPLFVDETQ
jgi:prepilin-type N-terminal cleavage/methylation domain-containing protein